MLSGRTPPERPQGTACSVDTLLNTLPDGEAEALRAMLADPRWSHVAIFNACDEEGYKVGRQTVSRHRNGSCRCGKT